MPSTCTERAVSWGILIVLLLIAAPVLAQEWERLIMPGDVIEGHADFEGDCSSCHRPFRRQEQRELCMACHDHSDVAKDISAGEGFHGRGQAREGECSTCHTEHAGRDADIVGLDAETFDHSVTDYALHGLHVSLDCASCHDKGEKHRDAPSECAECHAEQDAHDGTLGEDCGKCHDESGWKKNTEFDHDATDFPLVGKHRDAACASCHPGNRYENTPDDCSSCHQLNDVHGGRFGDKCESCHSPRDWKRLRFDHDADTDFPLRGAHDRVDCESCHRSGIYESEMRTACYACHEAHDEHKGRFGQDCEECHGEQSWKSEQFEHPREFPLQGAHADVSCIACHTGVLGETTLDNTCQGCHRSDDVHSGQQGEDCGLCHRDSGWTHRVFFDHGLTRFPLLGLHAVATCEDCHSSSKFQDAPETCVECHTKDDYHKGHLGTECAQCHNPNGWAFWRFDHDTQTDFKLDGAHDGLRCAQCHVRPVTGRIQMSMDCGSCHADDDVHLGNFGPNCGRCHSATTWDRVRRTR